MNKKLDENCIIAKRKKQKKKVPIEITLYQKTIYTTFFYKGKNNQIYISSV